MVMGLERWFGCYEVGEMVWLLWLGEMVRRLWGWRDCSAVMGWERWFGGHE